MAKGRTMRHRRSRKGGETPSDKMPMSASASMGMQGGKRGRKTRGRRGGDGAADWIISNFGGTTEQQFMNTFGNSGNGNAGALIPTLTGAPAVLPYNQPQGSLALNAGPVQGGGKRRRAKKGGYWAQVIETALVPFGLLGLQNAYGRRTRKNRK